MQSRVPAGCHLIAFDSVDSTNEEAKAFAASGAEEGTVVWARQQTAGRGRHGRGWQSLPGNLYLSVILRPDCAPKDAPQLGFATGVALAEAVRRTTDLPAALKWPNDLLIDGKKASGILLESAAGADGRLAWLIVGVGVNVANRPADLPGAISLREAGAELSVEQLLSVFLERMVLHVGRWRRHGFAPVRELWQKLALPTGAEISVRLPQGEAFGRFSGIDAHGCLLLETDTGPRRIDVGDVFPAASATTGEA